MWCYGMLRGLEEIWCYDNIARYEIRCVNFLSLVGSRNAVASLDGEDCGLDEMYLDYVKHYN